MSFLTMTPCDYFNDRPEKYLEIIICFMNSLCQYDLIILISLGATLVYLVKKWVSKWVRRSVHFSLIYF